MTLKEPYRLHRQMHLGDFLDRLAARGLLEWAWEYDDAASRALFYLAEPGQIRRRYLIRDAEAVAARIAAREGILWLPVPHPGNEATHRQTQDRIAALGAPDRRR